MPSPPKTPILLASIGAPHGVRGDVRVKSFTGDPEALGDYGPLFLKDGRSLTVKALRPAKTMMVVRFEGITSREQAEALNRQELFVDRSALPDDTEEDEFYIADLMGLDVVSVDGAIVGTIVAVPDFGAGDLLEIAPRGGGTVKFGRSFYLEFTKTNVPGIDLEKGVVTVNLPEEVSERD